MSNNVRGSQPPSPLVRIPIIRVTGTEPRTFVFHSKTIFGQYVHWYGQRSHECHRDTRIDCEGCKRGWPVKWLGYLHCNEGPRFQAFLEVTNTCYSLIDHQVGDKENLRGVQSRIFRTKGGAKGRYIVEVLERRFREEELVKELDPYDTLKFLWNSKKPALIAS